MMLKSPTHSTPVLGLKIRSRIRTAWCTAAKCLAQACMERALVQILVAVANIQMRTLKAEAEKVFVRTALVHESVSPKAIANASMTGVRGPGSWGQPHPGTTCADAEREVGPTFRHHAAGDEKWQHAFGDPHDAATGPWKSSLFFLMQRRSH